MDVEAQILKYLPRDARSSVSFIDEYFSSPVLFWDRMINLFQIG